MGDEAGPDMSSSEDEEDRDLPDIIGPLSVTYCGTCGCPPEYCEFTDKKWKNKCGPWLLENMDRGFLLEYGLVKEDEEEDELAEGAEGMSLEEGKEGKKPQTTKKGGEVGKGEKLMPGGKVKK